MSRVLILDCKDYNYVDENIDTIFSAFPREWNGKSVLVKPNMLNGRAPELGNTTHPSIVRSVTKWLINAGANVIVGDNPGTSGANANERCAEGSGIADASLGRYRNLSQEPLSIEIKSRWTNKVVISKSILDVDYLISLPKFKTHSLTQITGAIKNSFGFLIGGDKGRIHAVTGSYKNFVEAMVDIYQIRIPDLVIMDAIIGMEGNGPSSGNLRYIGKIIASDNGVAVDSVMTYMMGKDPNKLYMTKLARQRGLGETDISKMQIIGSLDVIDNFKMPSTFLSQFAGRVYNNRLLRSIIWLKPFILENKCKGCNVCVDNCPTNAMSMKGDCPSINRKICIRCYCCQELCPNDAIELKRF